MEYLWRLGTRVYEAVAALPGDLSQRMFRGAVNELLRPYLKDKLQLENMEAHFSEGVFVFRSLVLEEETLNKKLGSTHLTCRFARVETLTVAAPYGGEEELAVEAEGVTLVLSTSDDAELFRSHLETGSMMESVVGGFGAQQQYEEDEPRPDVDARVYLELQENIADLLATLKLKVRDCRVIVEHQGRVFEIRLREGHLFDTREFDTYTVTSGDVSYESVAAKLGGMVLPEGLPPFAVGESIRVTAPVPGLTRSVVQKAVRFRGVFVTYYDNIPVQALDQSGAGEELLNVLERSLGASLLSYDSGSSSGMDDGSEAGLQDDLLFFDACEDGRIMLSVALQSASPQPWTVNFSQDVLQRLNELVTAVIASSPVAEDLKKGESLGSSGGRGGGALSDFSVLYQQQQHQSMISSQGPLQHVSALSDWSLLGSYADSTLLRVLVKAPLVRANFATAKKAELEMRDLRLGFVSVKGKLQWSFEMDGGLSFVEGEKRLVSLFPGAMPFSARGDLVTELAKASHVISIDHAPSVVVESSENVVAALTSVVEMFSLAVSPAGTVSSSPPDPSPFVSTFKIDLRHCSVLVDGASEISCSDVSAVYESTGSSQRARVTLNALECSSDSKQVMAVTKLQLGLFWKNSLLSSSLALNNDVSKLVPVPFEGISAIWGSQSAGIKLTQSFVSSFGDLVCQASLHVDLLCDTFVANLSQSTYDRFVVEMMQPAAEVMWVTWGVRVRGDCIVSLAHESNARFDISLPGLATLGSMGHELKDSNFLMIDAERARLFVSNPTANLPRALLWQKLSLEPLAAASELDSLELTNLHTTLVCRRVTLSQMPGMRLVLRNCAVSPIAATWNLLTDFFSGPPSVAVARSSVVDNDGVLDLDDEDETGEPSPSAASVSSSGVVEGESKWIVMAENVAVLIQSRVSPTKSHAIFTISTLGVTYISNSLRDAWQLSSDVGVCRLLLSNSDSLPPVHRYLDLSRFVGENVALYKLIASFEGFNVGLMKDESISVNLVNFQDRPLHVRTCADSLAACIVLASNWSQGDAPEMWRETTLFGASRQQKALSEGDLNHTSLSVLGNSSMNVSSLMLMSERSNSSNGHEPLVPALVVLRNANLEVHLFLLEVREEFKVGATVRIRWEYRRGVPTEYDWVGMYKTTRSKGSKNYYAESLTGGKKFGVLEWKVPNKLGSIHFRFFRGSGLENLVAVSESFRVGPLVGLRVTRVKGNLYVERKVIKNDPNYGWVPKPTDWVGLYAWNETNKNRPFHNAFKKVGDMTSVPFDVPSSPGKFVFRYFADMGWGQSSELARSSPFMVSDHDMAQHDLVSRSAQPSLHWQVSGFHLRWTFTDGHDWSTNVAKKSPRSPSSPVDEMMFEMQIPMITYSVMSAPAKHTTQIHAAFGLIELHDHVTRSNYRSLLSFPLTKRTGSTPCVQVQLGQLRNNPQRWECRVDVAPLWLNVDQDTLIFVLRFGLACHELVCSELFLDNEDDHLLEQSFVMMDDEEQEEDARRKEQQAKMSAESEMVFETLSISAVDVEIDFRAKGRGMDTLLLNRRRGAETVYRLLYYVSSLLSFNESHLSLETLLLRNVPQSELVARLSQEWFPQIQRDNVSSLLAGFEPVKFVFRVGDASISLVQAPLGEFQQGGSVLTGLAEGGSNLGKTIYVETFRGLSNLLVGTGNVVKNVTRLAEGQQPSPSQPPAQHVKSQSPADLSEGFAMAGREIARGFQDAFNGVFFTPLATYAETGSASDAVVQVVRGMPGVVLKPIGAIFRGSSIPLRFAATSADPSIAQRATLKYKRPSMEGAHEESDDDDDDDNDKNSNNNNNNDNRNRSDDL